MYFLKLFFLLSLIILSGCLSNSPLSYQSQKEHSLGSHSSNYSQTFDLGFETVWSATLISLNEMPLEKIDKEKGLVKTGWIEGWSQRKTRGILTDRFMDNYLKERHRIVLNISGNNWISSVAVRCQIQERARGGSAAYRWERKQSTGKIEKEVLTRIEDILSGKVKGL